MRTGLVAVAVVVLGAGALYGLNRVGPSTASDAGGQGLSATASPSSTPSPSLTMPAFAGTVTVDPHVPDAEAITPEVWASAGPGWALISYQEQWFAGDESRFGPNVIYLVSPEGTRYEIVNVEGVDTVSVLAWSAGSTTAVVNVTSPSMETKLVTIDLVSGEAATIGDYAPYIWSLRFLDANGSPVWTGNDATAALVTIGPDGTVSPYMIPAEDGAADRANAALGHDDCEVAAPFDEDSVVVSCATAANGQPSVVAKVSGTDVTVLADGDDSFSGITRAGDGVAASMVNGASDACATSYVSLSEGALDTIPGADGGTFPGANIYLPLGAAADRFVWGATTGCDSDQQPVVVLSSGLADGSSTVLMPFPEGRPANEQPYWSVTGVAVAH